MDIVYLAGYLLLLSSGEALSLYLYLSQMKASGRFLGVSSLALGLLGFISYFFNLQGAVYSLIWAGFLFSGVGAFLVEYRRPGAAVILAIPFFILALTIFISLPLIILFATLTFEVGVLDAWMIGRTDSKRTADSEAGRRGLLAPFYIMGKPVIRAFPTRWSSIFFVSYCLLPIAAIVFAIVVWFLVGEVLADAVIIGMGFYFALSTRILVRKPTR